MSVTSVRIVLSPALRKALEGGNARLLAPLKDALAKSGYAVEGRAKMKVPVDTGRLRASIGTRLEESRAVVGTNVVYAPYVEFGTRPHFPPLAALQPWARRHGFPPGMAGAFLVARAIARRGTRAKPYLRPALRDSLVDMRRYFEEAASEIERRWRGG